MEIVKIGYIGEIKLMPMNKLDMIIYKEKRQLLLLFQFN